MSISQSRYVDIKTKIEPENSGTRKELIGRFFTSSDALSSDEIVEFPDLYSVLERFSFDSNEYKIANKYFSYVSRTSVTPQKISFANFHKSNRAGFLRATQYSTLADLKAITAGSLKITMDGITVTVSELDFSEATDYASIATILQTAIRTVEGWTDATVTFIASNGFKLTSGTPGASVMGYAEEVLDGHVAYLLGWTIDARPQVSNGADAETVLEAFKRVVNVNNNFGSFAFVDSLTTDEIASIAEYNHTLNTQYLYSVNVNSVNYISIQNAVKNYDGVALTYNDNDSAFSAFMPMAIMAGTDYDAANGTVNYMFSQFSTETPSVTKDSLANTLDALHINYYGLTQSAGKNISFYQRGYLQGEIHDMGVYANEIWLKSAISSLSLSLLLDCSKIAANKAGVGLFRAAIQTVIEEAINNGSILPEKELSKSQRLAITQLTGDDDAWRQVEQVGYWLIIDVITAQVNGVTEYHLKYTLIYSKGDSIRKITGSDVLV